MGLWFFFTSTYVEKLDSYIDFSSSEFSFDERTKSVYLVFCAAMIIQDMGPLQEK
jgi:hypothetical protein